MEVLLPCNEVRTVNTASEEFALWFSKTLPLIQDYESLTCESTSNFSQSEKAIISAFKEGAGLVTAGLLNTTSKDPSVIAQVKEIQQSSDTPLRAPTRQTIFIRLLCGMGAIPFRVTFLLICASFL